MTIKEQKYFADKLAKLDSDSSEFSVGANDFVNMENCRSGSTDTGGENIIESIGGTLQVSPIRANDYIEIGSVEDTENFRVCIFYFDKTIGRNDKIECYYTLTQATYTVLLSSDVVGGLNFSKYSPIHSAGIANGLLSWPDSTNNEPRQINIEAGIKAYQPAFVTKQKPFILPMQYDEILKIKRPPNIPPSIFKFNDTGFNNNFIANNSYQFAYDYTWYDNEESVTSAYSVSSRLNSSTDILNNAIYVQFGLGEIVPQRVRLVTLIVRYNSTIDGKPTNSAKRIKTWDREVAAENILINTLSLDFTFYNNIEGEPLAADDALRPFDLVPIYSETGAFAENRHFLANTTDGYNTPQVTSLSAILTTTNIFGGTNITTTLISIRQGRNRSSPTTNNWNYRGWYIYLSASVGIQAGFYVQTISERIEVGGSDPLSVYTPIPTSLTFANLTFRGATYPEVLNYVGSVIAAGLPLTNGGYDLYEPTSSTITITGLSLVTYNVHKPNSLKKLGVVFYDKPMRRTGVVTNDTLKVSIPKKDFNFTIGINNILWQLSNTNALVEIPIEATHYAVVSTLDQTTRFFVDSFTDAAKYAQKTTASIYVFNSDVFITGAIGIGLNTTALYQSGLGYVFTEGDVCVLTRDDNTTWELPVIGQDGNYVIVKAQDIGTLAGRKFVYELYTPYKTSEQDPFYEIGRIYPILNPRTNLRQYSILSDNILGDTYALTRNYASYTYFASAMSPNDSFYKRWDTDNGKANFVTKLGQVKNINSISWSDTFIPNTAINGLSTYRVSNRKPVSEDCGGITKLILTSKVEQEGRVMLSICTVETNSMYLNESQITDSTGKTQFFTQANVIGTINNLKGNFGCIDPTSVVQYRGNVWFFDANNGRWVQYSQNGLDVISDNGMARVWKLWAYKYQSLLKTDIELLGDRPYIFTAVDGAHNELLISIPKLSTIPPKDYLPDYPTTVYPFDILDFLGKTIVYKLGNAQAPQSWKGAFTFTVEGFATLQNKLYSFNNGNMFEHNQTGNPNEFFGVKFTSKIMFVSNIAPQQPKVYQNILIESNIVPKFVYFYNKYPFLQTSDLESISFEDYEGIFYANILRNKIVPTNTGFTTDGLLTFEKMRNTNMLVMVEFEPLVEHLQLKFITIGIIASKGHRLSNG